MTGGSCDILVRAEDHRRIMEHLFPGDRDEHGAILRAGIVRSGRIGILKRQYTLVEKYRMGWSAWFER